MIRILSIDIGTSAIKVALFGNKMDLQEFCSLSLPDDSLETPKYWIESLIEIMNTLRPKAMISNNKALYVVVSGHGPSTVFIDKSGHVLYYNSWIRDEKIELHTDESSLYASQLMYVHINHNAIYKHTHTILSPAEYICYLLTEKEVTFLPNTLLFPYIWGTSLISKKELHTERLIPKPFSPGRVLGTAFTSFAKKLDIVNAQVVSGNLDYLSAILGAGNAKTNRILQRTGSSMTLNITYPSNILKAIEKKQYDIEYNLPSFFDEYHNLGAVVPYADLLYKKINAHIDFSRVSADGVIQYINKYEKYFIHTVIRAFEMIIKKTQTFEEIVDFIVNNVKDEYLGFTYILVLQKLLQHKKNMLEDIAVYAMLPLNFKEIVVSGGHAHNDTLMQLQAIYLKSNIIRYNPVYLELYGNLFLAMYAITNDIKYLEHWKHIPVDKVFSAKASSE